MAESGGESARRGFNFQDYVTVDYLLKVENADTLHIEKYDSDFALFVRNSEQIQNHYYQVKTQKNSHFTWNKFKKEVAPTFSNEIKKQSNSEESPYFYLITNCNPNDTLGDFFDQVEQLRKRKINEGIFKQRVGKGKVNRLKKKIGVSEAELMLFLRGLSFEKRTEKGVKSSIESYLKSLHPGKFRKAQRILLNNVHEANSKTFSREELEKEIGFDLDKKGETSTQIEPSDLSNELSQMKGKYESEAEDSVSVENDRRKMNIFSEQIEEETEGGLEEIELESTRAELNNDFNEFKKHQKEKRKHALRIKDNLESLSNLSEEEDEK